MARTVPLTKHHASKAVFIKFWSAAAGQIVRGVSQAVPERKTLQKFYQTLYE
jgi:hypothetical protein